MSKVRLLFAPENTGFADKLASALAESGYDPSTDDDPAAAALVIWSQASAASRPILSAARSALARRVLVPVALGKTPPPPSFEHLWPMDLAGWNGRADDPRWKFVLDELELATRRGVLLRPAAANDRGEPPPKRESVSAPEPPPVAPAPQPAPVLRSEPALYAEDRIETIRPRPNFPRIAIGGSIMLAALAGAGAAALLIGVSDGRRAAAQKKEPVVAFVVQPRPEAVAVPVTGAAADVAEDAEDAAAPTVLRDGATGGVDAPPTEETIAALEVPALAAAQDAEAPLTAGTEVVANEGVATGAAASTIEPAPPPSAVSATDISASEGDSDDPIAGLAFTATAASASDGTPLGRYLRDCLDCPDLAEIDAGSFLMGASPGDARAQEFEGPQTPVTVARPLAMAVRETTHDDWRLCVADGACPALGGAGKRPIAVTHAEAEAYAAWLSRKTGRRYRLPSEAEWEYAAGAGASAQNAFGLESLFDGVREWTADCWRASHAGRPGDAAVVGGLCQMRVIKGGETLRPVARDGAVADSRRSDIGFRVVRDLY
jgi:hypothetical protein